MRRICKDCGDVFAFEYCAGPPEGTLLSCQPPGLRVVSVADSDLRPGYPKASNVLVSAGQHHLPSSRQKCSRSGSGEMKAVSACLTFLRVFTAACPPRQSNRKVAGANA